MFIDHTSIVASTFFKEVYCELLFSVVPVKKNSTSVLEILIILHLQLQQVYNTQHYGGVPVASYPLLSELSGMVLVNATYFGTEVTKMLVINYSDDKQIHILYPIKFLELNSFSWLSAALEE